MILSEQIATDLLRIKAVFLRPAEPFTWASGIKSPIYCDNRLTLSDVAVREDVENGLVTLIREYYPEAEVLMGTSTAGIAHAAITATKMNLPMGYVRSGAKDHGRQNQIEGRLLPGQKVVVVEDLISTGGSSLKAVAALREYGVEVVGMVASFTYGFPVAEKAFEEAGVKLITLSNYEAVVEEAAKTGYIKEEEKAVLAEWRKDPAGWRK